jgi:hypothetical protein
MRLVLHDNTFPVIWTMLLVQTVSTHMLISVHVSLCVCTVKKLGYLVRGSVASAEFGRAIRRTQL